MTKLLEQGKKISGKRVNEDKYLKLFEFIMFDPLYREMPDKAKILYSFLRSKVPYFEKQTEAYQMGIEGTKSYLDEEGNIFILADNSELIYILNCSEPTLISMKKILANYGLLYEEKRKDASNRIYVLLPSKLSDEWGYIDEIKELRKKREEERKQKNERLKMKKLGKEKAGDLKNLSYESGDLKNLSYGDLKNLSEIELNVLELELNVLEEEEEKATHSELVSFLLSKDITLDNALVFEKRLLEEGLTGYTYDQVIDALELSFNDFLNGHCNSPYKWAVGKLEMLLDGKIQAVKGKPKQRKGKAVVRKEILPEWFKENEHEEQQQPEQNAKAEEKEKQQKEIEEMLKKLRA